MANLKQYKNKDNNKGNTPSLQNWRVGEVDIAVALEVGVSKTNFQLGEKLMKENPEEWEKFLSGETKTVGAAYAFHEKQLKIKELEQAAAKAKSTLFNNNNKVRKEETHCISNILLLKRGDESDCLSSNKLLLMQWGNAKAFVNKAMHTQVKTVGDLIPYKYSIYIHYNLFILLPSKQIITR